MFSSFLFWMITIVNTDAPEKTESKQTVHSNTSHNTITNNNHYYQQTSKLLENHDHGWKKMTNTCQIYGLYELDASTVFWNGRIEIGHTMGKPILFRVTSYIESSSTAIGQGKAYKPSSFVIRGQTSPYGRVWSVWWTDHWKMSNSHCPLERRVAPCFCGRWQV